MPFMQEYVLTPFNLFHAFFMDKKWLEKCLNILYSSAKTYLFFFSWQKSCADSQFRKTLPINRNKSHQTVERYFLKSFPLPSFSSLFWPNMFKKNLWLQSIAIINMMIYHICINSSVLPKYEECFYNHNYDHNYSNNCYRHDQILPKHGECSWGSGRSGRKQPSAARLPKGHHHHHRHCHRHHRHRHHHRICHQHRRNHDHHHRHQWRLVTIVTF